AGEIYWRLRAADRGRGDPERAGLRDPAAGDTQGQRAGSQERFGGIVRWPRADCAPPYGENGIILSRAEPQGEADRADGRAARADVGRGGVGEPGHAGGHRSDHAGEGQGPGASDSDRRAGIDGGARYRSRSTAQLRERPAYAGTRSIDRVERKSDSQQLGSASDRRGAAAQASRMADARAT